VIVETIVRALGARVGTNGKVLVHCHAGCEQLRVIAALNAPGIWRQPRRHLGALILTHISPTKGPLPSSRPIRRASFSIVGSANYGR